MKKIRTMLVALTALTMFSAGSAFATDFWVGSVADSAGNFTANNVMGFDWSSSGSGMAEGFTAGQPIPTGEDFTFNFQASLVGLTDALGQSVLFSGLNTDFEYTLVAKIEETVVSVVSAIPNQLFPQTAFFETLGGEWYMYYDADPNSNVADGYGFDDGILVASGTITPGQLSTFSATTATQGIGSWILTGGVDFVDSDYLDPDLTIMSLRAEGTLNLPPLDSLTDTFFDGDAGEGNLDTVAVGNDIVFKADASSKFNVVPEPSTYILLGLGLLGLVGFNRRQK